MFKTSTLMIFAYVMVLNTVIVNYSDIIKVRK